MESFGRRGLKSAEFVEIKKQERKEHEYLPSGLRARLLDLDAHLQEVLSDELNKFNLNFEQVSDEGFLSVATPEHRADIAQSIADVYLHRDDAELVKRQAIRDLALIFKECKKDDAERYPSQIAA